MKWQIKKYGNTWWASYRGIAWVEYSNQDWNMVLTYVLETIRVAKWRAKKALK